MVYFVCFLDEFVVREKKNYNMIQTTVNDLLWPNLGSLHTRFPCLSFVASLFLFIWFRTKYLPHLHSTRQTFISKRQNEKKIAIG